jgi:hypothetical protein
VVFGQASPIIVLPDPRYLHRVSWNDDSESLLTPVCSIGEISPPPRVAITKIDGSLNLDTTVILFK